MLQGGSQSRPFVKWWPTMIREVIREWKSSRDRGDTNVLLQMLEEDVDHLLNLRKQSAP
jgi:hypothetical protein